MLKVVCFKWTTGSKKPYTGAHVNRLYESLRYYTSGDFSLTCITDDRSGISNEIDMIEMPESCRKVIEFPGRQYPKLYFFSEEFSAYITDKFVYLDVVLTGDISFLARSNARLSIMSGVGKKALYGRLQYLIKRRKIPRTDAPVNSSVMAVEPFSHTHIWDSFDPRRSPNKIAQSRLVGTD